MSAAEITLYIIEFIIVAILVNLCLGCMLKARDRRFTRMLDKKVNDFQCLLKALEGRIEDVEKYQRCPPGVTFENIESAISYLQECNDLEKKARDNGETTVYARLLEADD